MRMRLLGRQATIARQRRGRTAFAGVVGRSPAAAWFAAGAARQAVGAVHFVVAVGPCAPGYSIELQLAVAPDDEASADRAPGAGRQQACQRGPNGKPAT